MQRSALLLMIALAIFSQYAIAQPTMYWSDVEIGQILSANLDGTNAEPVVAKNFPAWHVVDLDNEKIYWTDTGTRSVHVMNLDGSAEEVLIDGMTEPQGIDIFEGELYVVDFKTIAKYTLQGDKVADLVTGLENPTDMVIHEGFMYWGDRTLSTIMRAPTSGTSAMVLINDVEVLNDITVDPQADELYWTQTAGVLQGSGIYKASVNGSGKTKILEEFVSGVAVDPVSETLYWTERITNSIRTAPLTDPANNEKLVDEFLLAPQSLTLDPVGDRIFFINDQFADFFYSVQLSTGDGLEVLASSEVYRPTRFGIDTLNDHLYWVNSKSDFIDDESSAIMRADLDGSNIIRLIGYPAVENPFGIALDVAEGKMYWTDEESRTVKRADLNGSNIETVVGTDLLLPRGLALDKVNSKIYWADANASSIKRSDLDGSNIETILDAGLESPFGIYVVPEEQQLYFADNGNGTIGRFDFGGETFSTLVTTSQPSFNRPNGVAIDRKDEKIYFTVDFTDEMIMRVNFDGTNLEEIPVPFIASPHDIEIIRPTTSSAKDIKRDERYSSSVSPNPFTNRLVVNSDVPLSDVIILDSSGREILRRKVRARNEIEVSIPGLAPGIYTLIVLTEAGRREVHRLVRS